MKKRTQKIILAGAIIDIISILFPAISYWSFRWLFLLEPAVVWRWIPGTRILEVFSTIELLIIFLINTLLAFFFTWIFFHTQDRLSGNRITKGIKFGTLAWFGCVILPIFSAYVLTNIARAALMFLAVEGLIEFMIYGITAALILVPMPSANDKFPQPKPPQFSHHLDQLYR